MSMLINKDDIKDYDHDYEILENEYNLGLIDQKQFEREKEKLKNNDANN